MRFSLVPLSHRMKSAIAAKGSSLSAPSGRHPVSPTNFPPVPLLRCSPTPPQLAQNISEDLAAPRNATPRIQCRSCGELCRQREMLEMRERARDIRNSATAYGVSGRSNAMATATRKCHCPIGSGGEYGPAVGAAAARSRTQGTSEGCGMWVRLWVAMALETLYPYALVNGDGESKGTQEGWVYRRRRTDCAPNMVGPWRVGTFRAERH